MKVLYARSTGDTFRADGAPDSAVLRCGEPLFLPEDTADYRGIVAGAVRIGRLGTHIPLKRAHLFRDAFSLVHVLLPADNALPLPPLFLDRTISPGVWDTETNDGTLNFTAHIMPLQGIGACTADEAAGSFDFNIADRAISFFSEYLTFKTGDIIIIADGAVRFNNLSPDCRLIAQSQCTEYLNIKLK